MKDPLNHRIIEPSVLYVGTPVYLVGTKNRDGSTNVAPASSHFALGKTVVLGLEEGGQSLANLRRHPELTVNFLAASQWVHAERLAGVTGKAQVPPAKAADYEFEPDKFARAGLSPAAGHVVGVEVVREAPIQVEAKNVRIVDSADGTFAMVEAQVVCVHASDEIVVAGSHHLNPHAWHPLIYSYRHFFDRGAEVGWTRKSPLARPPAEVARWQAEGGTWKVQDADPTSATVVLTDAATGLAARTVVSAEPDFVRWANVQASIHGGDRH